MLTTTTRRLAAALFAPALAAGVIAAAPSAQAAGNPPNSYSYSAARWLADQLTDGLVVTDSTTRYGQTLDILFALDGLGVRPSTVSNILGAFETDQEGYTTGESFSDTGSHYAGPTAKLATAVYAAEQEPTSFGGHNLITELTNLVTVSGLDQGRVSDVSLYGDNSNTLGQGFAVRALSAAASPQLADVTDYLLKQQCPNGSFRTFEYTVAVPDPDYPVDPVDRVCGEGPNVDDDSISVDTTAFSIQALLDARDGGVTGLDDDIADAVVWLKSQQAADGSFKDLGNANTTSTGLAAATLKLVGEQGAAASAASWVVGRQVTDAVGEDTQLSNELGAVAPDDGFLVDGKTDGITSTTRINWVISTAQAALGVNAQLSATTLGVTAPTTYVQGGKKASVKVTGLAKGEKFSASFAGGTPVTGTANASGDGAVAVTTQKTTGSKTVTVTGSRAARKGTVTVKTLGAKKLSPKLSYSSVKAGKSQKVTVSGLATGERVKVYQSNVLKKAGTASSSGKYSLTYKVGSSKGKKTVKVVGGFTSRVGAKTFKIK